MRFIPVLPLIMLGGISAAADVDPKAEPKPVPQAEPKAKRDPIDTVASDYWFRLLPSFWFAHSDGNASYGHGGAIPTQFSLGSVGLDNRERTFSLEGSIKFTFEKENGKHALLAAHIGITDFTTEGSSTLGSNLTFGNQTFLAGSTVATDLSMRDLWFETCLRLINADIAGFSIGLAVHQLDTELGVSGGPQSARLSEDPLLLMFALRGYFNMPFAPSVGLEAKVHGLSLPTSKQHSDYLDADIHAIYRPWELIGFTAGYHYVLWDVKLDDPDGSGSSADLSLTLAGPYLGMIAKF